MAAELFDMQLRALRRDRAARTGPELFLHERAFADCLERIGLVQRRFESALLVGCPDPQWPARLREIAPRVEAVEPGPLFARASGATSVMEEEWAPPPASYDLCMAVGTLDTVNDLPGVMRSIRMAMKPGSLFIGALSGGDTLPQLRSAMRAADRAMGFASAHVHPRIEPSALAPLLSASGFVTQVVDVDRVPASYASLERLVADLRSMGTTNILKARPRLPLTHSALAAARADFAAAGAGERTAETFEILHFAAWVPGQG